TEPKGLLPDLHPQVEAAGGETPAPELPTLVRDAEMLTPPALPPLPIDLSVDSGMLPLSTDGREEPTRPQADFELDIDVDPGLVEQLAAGIAPDVDEPSHAEAFPAPPPHAPTHALLYWDRLATRLHGEAERALQSGDRRRAAVLHYELGRLYEGRLGRAAHALAWLELAFELDPGFVPNLRALRRTLVRRGNVARAVEVMAAELSVAARPDEQVAILLERASLRERLQNDLEG